MKWLTPASLATDASLQTILADAEGVWALAIVDGVQAAPGHRILVKDEPSDFPFQKGIYEVRSNGDWVFVDEAEPGETAVLVTGGDGNQDCIFVLSQEREWLKLLPGEDPEDVINRAYLGLPPPTNGWDDDPLSMDRL